MTIKEQIESILSERKKKSQTLKDNKAALMKVLEYLKELRGFRSKTQNISDQALQAKYSEIFKEIDTKEVEKEINALRGKIDDAIKRFERDHISIATVGKARQGKSTFLQSVGDLQNDIIPAYDTGDCTGATSVIYNDSSMEPGKVSVKIIFKEQQDLVDIVTAYMKKIDEQYLAENPVTFEDVEYINLADLEERIPEGDANKSKALEHLSKIVNNFDTIRYLFGKGSISSSNPEEIKTFVAQSNGKKVTDPDVEFYYKYLAVARAEISCRFYEDCGKIVLVDTVGLGDTQVGIDTSMLRTVDSECDAAIVVTKPISDVHEEDMKLYETLLNNFESRKIEQWLFYAANLHRGNNDNAVDTFEQGIKNGNYKICDVRKVDCSNRQDVNENFMKPLLEKLVHNMDEIDKAYLNDFVGKTEAIIQSCNKLISSLPELQTINPSQEASQKAYEAGQTTYAKMTAQLKNQVLYWKKEKDRPNNALWNRVQTILNGMDNLAPQSEDLQKIIDSNGNMTPNGLWEATCNYVRNEITDRFNEIDSIMEKETINFKNTLVEHMYYALQNMISGGASKADDNAGNDANVDMLEWLKNIMNNVINNDSRYRQISKAFLFLCEFEFSIKENIIQEVRKQLYTLNPIADGYYAPAYNFSPINTGEEVHYYLTSRLAIIEDELRHSLFNLYRKPNQTFYAAAEEFYDRITFAIDLSDETDSGFLDMNLVWGRFFMQYNQKLWNDNADKYNSVNTLIEQYNGAKYLLADAVKEIRA
ncbi:MAG: GTPase domain-containing protein [Clostridia bacterium]|nr:GTPase domain-containing protein [Clostridia bacterium]